MEGMMMVKSRKGNGETGKEKTRSGGNPHPTGGRGDLDKHVVELQEHDLVSRMVRMDEAGACITQEARYRAREPGVVWLSTKATGEMEILTEKTHDEALWSLERTSQCQTLCASSVFEHENVMLLWRA